MELLIIGGKERPQLTQQNLVKILLYADSIGDSFSTIHVLSSLDQSQAGNVSIPSKIVVHLLKRRQGNRSITRLVLFLGDVWRFFWAGRKLLKKHPEIKVITNPFAHYFLGFIAVVLARSTGRKALIRISGNVQIGLIAIRAQFGKVTVAVLGSLLLAIERFVLRKADWIITVSPLFLEHYPQYADKTAVIPLPVPILDQYCSQEYATEARSVSPDGYLRAIYAGRLTPEKGLATLIEALTDLPQVSCQLVGDGNLRRSLEQQVQSLGLESRVTFCGYLPHERVFELMSQADVLVLPSLTEYTPNVLIEAAAVGLPAIATDVGGVKYMVKDGQTGLLCKANDAASLRQQLLHFSQIPELGSQLAQNARDWACKNYRTAIIKQQAEFFLQRCIQEMDGQNV